MSKDGTDDARARLVAAWESAAIQTLDPLLSELDAERVWTAILAHREHNDAQQFAEAAREIAKPLPQRTGAAIEGVISSLFDLSPKAEG